MKTAFTALLIISTALLLPAQNLYADNCDYFHKRAEDYIKEARAAINEKDYKMTGELYGQAVEYFEMITKRNDCGCPRIVKEAPGNVEKFTKKASHYNNLSWESGLKKEYDLAFKTFKEGYSCVENKNYEEGINLLEKACKIWNGVGAETKSVYSEHAIAQAHQVKDIAIAIYIKNYLAEK